MVTDCWTSCPHKAPAHSQAAPGIKPPRPPPWPQTPDPCSRTTNAGAQAKCDDDAKNAKSRAWNTPSRPRATLRSNSRVRREAALPVCAKRFPEKTGLLARTSAAGQITQASPPWAMVSVTPTAHRLLRVLVENRRFGTAPARHPVQDAPDSPMLPHRQGSAGQQTLKLPTLLFARDDLFGRA